MQNKRTKRDIKVVWISWAIAIIPVIYIRIFKYGIFLDHYYWSSCLIIFCYICIVCLLGIYLFGSNAVRRRSFNRAFKNVKLKHAKMKDFYKNMSNQKIKNKFL